MPGRGMGTSSVVVGVFGVFVVVWGGGLGSDVSIKTRTSRKETLVCLPSISLTTKIN